MKINQKTLLSFTLCLGSSLMLAMSPGVSAQDEYGGTVKESSQSVITAPEGNVVDSFRESLPETRPLDVLRGVQNAMESSRSEGTADAFNLLNSSGILWLLNTLTYVFAILAGVALVYQSSLDILYFVFPGLRMFMDDDDVAQRTSQMANAQMGIQGGGTNSGGILSWVRSFFKVSDDALQAMIEGGLMNSSTQTGGGVHNPMGNRQGAMMGVGNTNPMGMGMGAGTSVVNAKANTKHVMGIWFKKRAFTFVLTALALGIFVNGGALNFAIVFAEFIQRIVDFFANIIAGI